jgi:MFS family permease
MVVLGSWCALFSSLGIMNTMGSFQEYISMHQLKDIDVASVGWIFSLYAFLTFGIGLFDGPLFDKYGPRWLILGGSILIVLGMILTGISSEFWHFILCFSLLGGVGSALLFTPSIAIVGHYFDRRRGYATGLAATGAFGGIVFPVILQMLVPRIGFSWSTKFIAAISFTLCGFANIFIRSRLSTYQGSTFLPILECLKRKLLLVPLKTLSPFIFSSNIGSRDISREQQL